MGAFVSVKYRLFVAVAVLCMSTAVFAVCPAPAQPGLHICFPSAGSTVSTAIFEFGWNTNGAAVTDFQMFDNGKLIDDFGFITEFMEDGAVHDGHHNITAKIFDSSGKQYSASVSFTQVGFDPPFGCPMTTAGVRICYPANGGVAPTNTPLVLGIKGTSKITGWKVFVNGKLQTQSIAPSVPTNFATNVTSQPGANSLTVTATDAAGHKYSTTHKYTAFYTDFECAPKGNQCFPGIEVEQPTGFDTPTQFRFQATVRDNPAPINWMSVYLDGHKVAGATGPFVLTTIKTTHGSHIVTAIAQDSKGHMYHVSTTYNVQ
jgi:hypothetical protein